MHDPPTKLNPLPALDGERGFRSRSESDTSNSPLPMGVEAILLAAGESSRMGTPKPLLPWFGKTMVEAQIENLLDGGADRVIVVTGARGDEVENAIHKTDSVTVVDNPHYLDGKTTTIRAGLGMVSDDCSAILLLAVDQPRPNWVVRRIVDSHLTNNAIVTSPRYQGHGGHPLAFHPDLLPELREISEEREGVREVMRRHEAEMNGVRFDSPIVRIDLNTPEDYERALEVYPTLSANSPGEYPLPPVGED